MTEENCISESVLSGVLQEVGERKKMLENEKY
jgi:hypothetical protein